MICAAGGCGSYGPKSALVLRKPVEKHGSEVADRSMTTPVGNGSDLDGDCKVSHLRPRSPHKERAMAKRREKRSCRPVLLEPNAAGIDVGAEEIYVAVPPDRCEESVRRFSSFTCDLHALADWLIECWIRTVAGIHRSVLDPVVPDS